MMRGVSAEMSENVVVGATQASLLHHDEHLGQIDAKEILRGGRNIGRPGKRQVDHSLWLSQHKYSVLYPPHRVRAIGRTASASGSTTSPENSDVMAAAELISSAGS